MGRHCAKSQSYRAEDSDKVPIILQLTTLERTAKREMLGVTEAIPGKSAHFTLSACLMSSPEHQRQKINETKISG